LGVEVFWLGLWVFELSVPDVGSLVVVLDVSFDWVWFDDVVLLSPDCDWEDGGLSLGQ
jgi:hypothetical protein